MIIMRSHSTKKRNILVTTSTYWRWKGDVLPSFVHELSKRLGEHFNVYVLAPHATGAEMEEDADGIHIIRYRYFLTEYGKLCESAILPNLKNNPLLWLQVPFFLIAQFIALCHYVKKYNIHIIHAHWIIPQGVLGVLYKYLLNKQIKVIVTTHGGDIFGLRFWPMPLIKRWTLNHCDYLTVVSQAIKNEVLSLGVRKNLPIEILPMGVDFSSFHPDYKDQKIKEKYNINGPLLLFVGRLSEKKGIEYLIQSMPSILSDFPEVKLMIIGGGEKESDLRMLAKKLGLLDESVIFTGAIPHENLPAFYATADLFIGPSIQAEGGDQEGFGLVFAEAIGSGTFTMGTDLPAIADIIEEGKTGFIVQQKNVDQIALKVKYILSNQLILQRMRESAREIIVEKFDWSIICQKYTELIEQL